MRGREAGALTCVSSVGLFADQLVSEDGEEAKQEGGADAGQQRLEAGHQTTQGAFGSSSPLCLHGGRK